MSVTAYLIDSAAQDVRPITVRNLGEIQAAVGGYIDVAYMFPDGEALFVDDDGLHKPQEHFFLFADKPQPLAGNGVIMPAEDQRADGGFRYRKMSFGIDVVRRHVRFLDRAAVERWGLANDREPQSAVGVIGPDGRLESYEVTGHWGRTIADMPPPEEKK